MDAQFIRMAFVVVGVLLGICLVGGITLAALRIDTPAYLEVVAANLAGAIVGILVQVRREHERREAPNVGQ